MRKCYQDYYVLFFQNFYILIFHDAGKLSEKLILLNIPFCKIIIKLIEHESPYIMTVAIP